NRNFRNEGADSTHSPEFAMLEAYQAYSDYNGIADLTQELIQNAAIAVTGSTEVTWADGTVYDLGGEWERMSMYDSLNDALADAWEGADAAPRIDAATPLADLTTIAERFG
ncbi:MAG TPA: lysine--tRNA ligase, partial [Microbacterium sp.]|nr:lysine--tRNA ligase [Microbacterium sp.]